MPLALITVQREKHPKLGDQHFLQAFANELRNRIANVLTCADEGGKLSGADIEVEIRDHQGWRHVGGAHYDIQIVVLANEFPARKANLGERTLALRKMIQLLLPLNITGFVWVRLAPAAFEEFGIGIIPPKDREILEEIFSGPPGET